LFFDLDGESMRDRCLGRTSGRADDNEETIKKRLANYKTETVPVITKMIEQGNVYKIDSSKAKEEVFMETCVNIDQNSLGILRIPVEPVEIVEPVEPVEPIKE